MAVTKTHPVELVRKACAVGLHHFGENRVQESIEKYVESGIIRSNPDIVFHLVGHLQRNKARRAVQVFGSIDSVDTVDLARILDLEAGKARKWPRVLLEVNTSNEPQKFGIEPDSTFHLATMVMGCRNLQLAGLMTVGPTTTEEPAIRKSFRLLRELFDRVAERLKPEAWSVMSMGMSGDFEIAIEEGATELRLGTALFGQRRKE